MSAQRPYILWHIATRLDGDTSPATLGRASVTFAAVLTLAAAVTGVLAQLVP
ncbi:hypothetical protein AB0442_38340 [Kitasatospora sp. NPDC085895]|uniref:hypothetical protein n=1 Tax=Kitasatospora sp. NPDC085895 TaxID=3155057 RepID=UPI00344DF268